MIKNELEIYFFVFLLIVILYQDLTPKIQQHNDSPDNVLVVRSSSVSGTFTPQGGTTNILVALHPYVHEIRKKQNDFYVMYHSEDMKLKKYYPKDAPPANGFLN